MAINLNEYVKSGEVFLKKIAKQLGTPEDTAKAGRVLRAVLRVFRNQSTPQEGMQLISQLPMFIKAIYVDGWQIGKKTKKIRHMNDFLYQVQQAAGNTGGFDFSDDEETKKAVKAVFHVIKEYASAGEIDDIINTLPEELRPMVKWA